MLSPAELNINDHGQLGNLHLVQFILIGTGTCNILKVYQETYLGQLHPHPHPRPAAKGRARDAVVGLNEWYFPPPPRGPT